MSNLGTTSPPLVPRLPIGFSALAGVSITTTDLLLLCGIGVALRLALAALFSNIICPDEIFQYLEQPYRLISGRGLMPWEFHIGARSWLLPGAMVPFVKLALMVSDDPRLRIWFTTIAMTLLSAASVAASYFIGRNAGGRRHAMLSGLLAAVWCELVLYSPHVLADTACVAPLLAGFALLGLRPDGRRDFIAGLLFGVAVAIRIQILPAVLVALCGAALPPWRHRILHLTAGFALALVLLFGALDWVTWGRPFSSAWSYIAANRNGIADQYSTEPSWYFAMREVVIWRWAAPFIAVTALNGARRLPLVALATAIMITAFSFVPHKEMRFIFPALSLLFVLCGVGTGDLVGLVSGSRQRTALWIATAAALTWCATSFYVANARQMIALWSRDGDWLAAMNLIAASPDACGVGLDPASEWHHTGQVHLRSDQLLFDAQQGFDRFNFILRADGAGSTPLPPSYRSIACYPGKDHVCVLARQGGCSSDSKAAPLTAEAGDTVVSILRRVGLLQP